MNMLNLIKFEVLNSLLLALKPKPQTEPNRNIASQKPVWNQFGILRFFGHPSFKLKYQFVLPNQTSEGLRSSPEPPELPLRKDEPPPPPPGFKGKEVISLEDEMTECLLESFLVGGGTIKPDLGIFVVY